MNICKVVAISCLALVLSLVPAAAEDFTNAIHAFLQHRVGVEKRDVGIVVGIMDEHGSSIVSCGEMKNGTGQEVNGDTLFDIGSVGKTFTALLLQDLVERGEMKLDDPATKYLPKSVKLPAYNGKQITLLHLATHTSGLPNMPEDIHPKRADNAYAEYTVENLNAFVSGYRLTCDPGTKYRYSGVGMALLGQAIALKAGTNYESLVVDRICRPLKMDSTRITLTPELKSRLATGHNPFGDSQSRVDLPALAGAGAFRSTANDLLKYMSANLDVTPSSLTPLMERTHVPHFDVTTNFHIGLGWEIGQDRQGGKLISHGGGSLGFITWAALDMTRRRGVVVLSNSQDQDVPAIGYSLLESEWQSDRRPKQTKINRQVYDSFVGHYQLLSEGRPQTSGNVVVAPSQPGIDIRGEGDRLFAQPTSPTQFACELLPESETRFFNRLTGMPVTFSRDAGGKAISLTESFPGAEYSFKKTSDQLPKAPEPPKPHIRVKLDPKVLDACVGQYEFATNSSFLAGMKLTIRRERGQLVGQAWSKMVLPGAFDIYPQSETNFFLHLDVSGAQLTFIKNQKGELTGVIYHSYAAGWPDWEGKKLKD